jgi:HCOMODA/2-hydroxy-3-carboxy-muconic semialdehyde decarboxylase
LRWHAIGKDGPDLRRETIEDLVLANRILANEGVVDGFGHVSVRDPDDPGRYLLSRAVSPELVTVDDILGFTLDNVHDGPRGTRVYSERAIHGAVYAARPDVGAVCHHHAEAVLPFCVSDVRLVPVTHLGAVMGEEIPVWDSRDEFGDTNLLVAAEDEARSLVEALGPHSVVLLRHHGAVVVGALLRDVVFRTIYTRVNAEIQFKAMALGGLDPLTPGETERAGQFNLKPHAVERSWDRWVAGLDAGRDAGNGRQGAGKS